MKKTTKILAVILAILTLMSSMSIMVGAVSSKSSAKELLNYYEDCIIKTSAKEDVIKTAEVYKFRDTADYSSLEGDDLEATMADNEAWEIYENKWYEDKWDTYFFCDAYEDYYSEGRSEFVDYFSIKRDIRRLDLSFKSAKCTTDKNGKVTLTFVYLYTDEEYKSTMTYTIKINNKNYVESYTLKDVTKETVYSIEENPYTVTSESINTFKFIYNKVDAKSIELSENSVALGKDEECYITVKVNPDNATYKDFYIDWDSYDYDVADCYIEEDGTICVFAMGPGETSIDVHAYSGDVVETIDVVVEYTFFERIISFFENITWEIQSFFEDILWSFEDLLYGEDFEEEYIEDEEEFICGTEF